MVPIAIVAAVFGLGSVAFGAAAPSGSMSPRLTAAQLLAGFDYAQPLAFEAYAPSAAAGAATHRFERLLELNGEAHGGALRSHTDRYGFAGDSDSPVRHLPEFAFELVQAGQALVPVRRGLVMTAHPQWEWLLEPGRVWREPGDGDYSRAALPFSLQERNANCTHNGVITFAFKRNLSRVSRTRSAARPALISRPISGGCSTQRIRRAALPVAPVSSRRTVTRSQGDCPRGRSRRWRRSGTASTPQISRPDEVSREHLTTWGVIVDGVHYVGGCPTRAGAYPFCDSIDLPSYSLAKSVFASAALMRLEKTHPGTRNLTAASFVAECAASGAFLGQPSSTCST